MIARHKVIVDGEQCDVEFKCGWGFIVTSGAGGVIVNGKVGKSWSGDSSGNTPREVPFEVGAKQALMVWRGIILQRFDAVFNLLGFDSESAHQRG